MNNAPIETVPVALFVYNRLSHAEKTLLSLANNEIAFRTNLYIFSDGAKNEIDVVKVNEVRQMIKQFVQSGQFKKVIVVESFKNKGLAKSIIEGVSQVFETHSSVVILEDDLLFAEDFLGFMNKALVFYESDASVGCVTGYNPLKKMPVGFDDDIYIMPRNCSLGWGTWKKVWMNVDWDSKDYKNFKSNLLKRRKFNACGMDRASRLDRQIKKNAQSWSIRFGYDLFNKNLMTIYSAQSKISHFGWDGSGTHSASDTDKFNVDIAVSEKKIELKHVKKNSNITQAFKELYGCGFILEIKELFRVIRNYFNF